MKIILTGLILTTIFVLSNSQFNKASSVKVGRQASRDQRRQQRTNYKPSDPVEDTPRRPPPKAPIPEPITLNTTWLDDWDKYMTDFTADFLMQFEIAGKSEEIFFEKIDKPCNLRGAYFVSYDSKDPISLYIRSPNKGALVFSREFQKEGIFSLDLNDTGEYQIIFSNLKSGSKKSISFAVDVSDNEEHLKQEDIDPLFVKLNNVKHEIQEYYQQTKFANKKRVSHAEVFKSTHNKLLLFSIFETIAIIACTAWQIYYIKKILDNRSLV